MSTVSLHGDYDEEIESRQRYNSCNNEESEEDEEPVSVLHKLLSCFPIPETVYLLLLLIILSILTFHERFQLESLFEASSRV